MSKLFVAVAFLGLNFYTYHFLATESVIPERRSFEEFPLEFEGGWKCPQRVVMEDRVKTNLGVTDYLICDYANQELGSVASLYVGYHATQVREEGGGDKENSIHPPAHCLPGSGWDIIHNETVPLGIEGMPRRDATVKRLIIAKGKARQLVYYWYQSRGRVISEDWKKIVFVGFDRATRRRTDGSLVRFTIPILEAGEAGEERAEEAFRGLAPQALALLPEYVPE